MKKRIIGSRASNILFNFLMAVKYQIKKPFLIPANVCPIVPITFLKANIPFIFSDVSLSDFLIDKENTIRLINDNKISGVIFVRSYGNLENERIFFRDLKQNNNNLIIIDDRCLCLPDIDGSDNYAEADLTLYSTGYAKFVEFNYGGFAFIDKKYNYNIVDCNFEERHHELLVSQMNEALKKQKKFVYNVDNWLESKISFNESNYIKLINDKIEKSLSNKNKINSIYRDKLPDEIQIGGLTGNWRFSILVDNKEKIISEIFKSGLFASSHYASISHIFGDKKAPNAEFIHKRIINLFNDYKFSESDAIKVSQIIKNNLY